MSYCRRCGGERHHSIIAETSRTWDEGVSGGDVWQIVECRGCRTITFVHGHWFSEDEEMTDEGPAPILHRDLYPPAPPRKMPEWGTDFLLSLSGDNAWISKVHEDIYAAVGLEANALAAMGARAIVDYVVTSKAGEKGNFKDKLIRMREQQLISETQVDVIYAAFDAGSAAAHRGFSPSREDVYTLLDITEALLEQIYIVPLRQRRQASVAAALKSKTPQRPPHHSLGGAG